MKFFAARRLHFRDLQRKHIWTSYLPAEIDIIGISALNAPPETDLLYLLCYRLYCNSDSQKKLFGANDMASAKLGLSITAFGIPLLSLRVLLVDHLPSLCKFGPLQKTKKIFHYGRMGIREVRLSNTDLPTSTKDI